MKEKDKIPLGRIGLIIFVLGLCLVFTEYSKDWVEISFNLIGAVLSFVSATWFIKYGI